MQATKAVILVYGCPGSGKTTFSKWLATHWRGVMLVSGDDVEGVLKYSNVEALQLKLDAYKPREGRQSD